MVIKLPGKNKINWDEKNLQHKLLEISLFFNFAAKSKAGFGDTEFIYSKNICDNNAYIQHTCKNPHKHFQFTKPHL